MTFLFTKVSVTQLFNFMEHKHINDIQTIKGNNSHQLSWNGHSFNKVNRMV